MKNENNKKEDCPLCQVSEDTIKNLENANKNLENVRLTKKEKYLFKKEKKNQGRLLRVRKKKNKKIIKFSLIFVVIILVVGGTVFGVIKYLNGRNFGASHVETSDLVYDAGTVSMADGLVKHTYEIKSVGEGDLKIKKIKTSCMCTTARLRVGDDLGPKLGMHDSFSWSKIIAPGETGFLEVVFDPSFHGPEGAGLVTRAIYVSTNDSENENIEFILMADVIE